MVDKPVPLASASDEECKKEGTFKEDWDLDKIERELEESQNNIERSKLVEESKSIADNTVDGRLF